MDPESSVLIFTTFHSSLIDDRSLHLSVCPHTHVCVCVRVHISTTEELRVRSGWVKGKGRCPWIWYFPYTSRFYEHPYNSYTRWDIYYLLLTDHSDPFRSVTLMFFSLQSGSLSTFKEKQGRPWQRLVISVGVCQWVTQRSFVHRDSMLEGCPKVQ